MKAKLIVAYTDNTWTDKLVEVPDGVVPDKYYRGSVKWTQAVLKWATENADLGKEIEYVGMLDANPEEE
ncbi:MAG: hypothetical protein ACWGQW_03265 [bacterium]